MSTEPPSRVDLGAMADPVKEQVVKQVFTGPPGYYWLNGKVRRLFRLRSYSRGKEADQDQEALYTAAGIMQRSRVAPSLFGVIQSRH